MLTELLARGIELKLSPEGKILARGTLTDADRQIIRVNRDALVSELVGAGRYVPGTLDAIHSLAAVYIELDFTHESAADYQERLRRGSNCLRELLERGNHDFSEN